MSNYLKDNQELRWYLDHGIDWEPIVELTEYLFRTRDGFREVNEAVDFYKDLLDLVGEFVGTEIAPHTAEIDREGVRFEGGEAVFPDRLQGIFDQLKAMELYGMCLPRELGGQNCPILIYQMTAEIFARADVSVMSHFGFHTGMAMAMLAFSLREGTTTFDVDEARITSTRFQGAIEEIRRGDAWGCMDITEPGAGSDMAALRTVARQDDSGQWRVTGEKIFITSGHGKYHFVIARTEEAKGDDPFAGLGGLSMFLVPTTEDGRRIVPLVRIEEKLGHHGSATAALAFEDAPAQLIGKRGEGFQYMLTLMNNARIGVAFESIGLMEAALRGAREYAAERRSMGKPIDRHEMIADYLDEMDTDIRGIRALAMASAFHEEVAQKIGIIERTGIQDARADHYRAQWGLHKRLSRRYTPLLKYLAAERAVDIARLCLQIHGGNGYTTDYQAEKLLRDAMVLPIYEGTSQIQALMAMKDTLGDILKRPQAFVRRVAQARWRGLSAQDPLERRVARVQQLSLAAQQHLITRTAVDKYRSLHGKPLTEWPERFLKNWNPKRDFAYAMLHAERLTRLLADEAICEVLLAQCRKHPDRRPVLDRYLERAEPRARYLHERITTTGDRLLDELSGAEETSARRAG